MRAEHLKLLLQDGAAIELLAEAATNLAQAGVAEEVRKALAMARLTALRQPDGGVRGIATGGPSLDRVLDLAAPEGPSRLPLRP